MSYFRLWLVTCLATLTQNFNGEIVAEVFYSSLVLEIICVVWDIYSTYGSKSFVQFILDHFVPNLILIRAFPPQLLII